MVWRGRAPRSNGGVHASVWQDALAAGADPVRARQFHARLLEAGAGPVLEAASPEAARVLTALWSGSQVLGEWLVQHPEWLPDFLDVEGLRRARSPSGLRSEVEAWLAPALAAGRYEEALARLRGFQRRELVRIAARDLGRLDRVEGLTRELSDLADVCLSAVFRVCWQRLTARLGTPYERSPAGAWRPTRFSVLGLGKLGGQELNYSSDVDVLFVYSDEGFTFKTPPRPGRPAGQGLPNHEFFRRLGEAFVAEVSRAAPEGMLYRIDLRLRPEGKAGPLARSLDSYENYYAQYGQTWERLMLIKARGVAGDASLAGEFLETIGPFRFPRLLGPDAVEEIAAMKRRLETEVVRAADQDRNIKLGRGGIREIEFIVQTRQVLQAGRQPFIGVPATLPALRKLAQYHLLAEEEARALAAAYEFLRDVEHRLQMEHGLQTHLLPVEPAARLRLARLMGCATTDEFEAALERHRRAVRGLYERVFAPESRLGTGAAEPDLPDLTSQEAAWKDWFARHSFRDPEQALRLARVFVHGPGFGHVPARTERAGRRLLARLLALCPRRDTLEERRAAAGPDGDPRAKWLSDPDRVLARLDHFVSVYGARALLFETWMAQPTLFELLLLLFDRSEFLAATALRTPDLLDDLEQSGRLREAKTAARTLAELRLGAGDADQRQWIRRYHEAEFMRVGLRDILGLADPEQHRRELTALAEACLQYALEVALRRHRLKTCPLAIIGLGKLGGGELTYGSDLDVVFVAEDKVRNLPGLQRVAVTVLELISSPTEHGVAFRLDARLRPDGEKGLLVNTLRAYADYYRTRAQLWEIQALTRARPVAGHPEVGARFSDLVGELTDFRGGPARVAAHTPDWKAQIAHMRRRIEKERTPPGKEALAFKTGAGGLMDAEFLAQALCLEHGWREPNTLRALERARAEGALPAEAATSLIENYRRLQRVEGILRRWSYEGEAELPDDPAPQYRVAVRCGFATAEDFLAAVARYRRAVRAAYAWYFAEASPSPHPGAAKAD